MINTVCGITSTGRICTDLAQALDKEGHEVKIAYGREPVPNQFSKYAVRIGTDLDVKIHGLKTRFFDKTGFGSKKSTIEFIEFVRKYNPDIIHLHNIHGYYINIEVLFEYLKEEFKGKVIWTLHDCWSYTGHCAYYDFEKCDLWKTGCKNCPQKTQYPKSIIFSNAKNNYKIKKQLFKGVNNMILVTPSKWLADEVKKSYLQDYRVVVINNGINTKIFKPNKSDIKNRFDIVDKKIILGVAAVWDRRKGLSTFIDLAKKINESYQIVVIGVTEEQKKELPENIIGVTRTNSPEELANWYAAADIFLNPTLEDNYPTTNIEAIACDTPVITFDTGGSPESAQMYGKVVGQNIDEILKAIYENSFKKNIEDKSVEKMISGYMELYSGIDVI